MDYIQELEWRNYLLNIKVRLLNDLRNYIGNADTRELSFFVNDLSSIPVFPGMTLKDFLLDLLGSGSPPEDLHPGNRRFSMSNPLYFESPGRKPEEAPLPEKSSSKQARPRPDSLSGQESGETEYPPPELPGLHAGTEEAGKESVNRHKEVLDAVNSKMKGVPSGSFEMGSDNGKENEKPVHKVSLPAFKISSTMVNCREYQGFILSKPEWQKDRIDPDLHDGRYLDDWDGTEYPEGKGDHPVGFVSYHAAEAFAKWIGKRLPSEAEWEKAARGGLVNKSYPDGDKMNDGIANFAKRFGGTTGTEKFSPNGYGLFDMAGNLFEWVSDWYGKYPAEAESSPSRPARGEYKVIRGGSWISSAGALRVSFRIDEDPLRCGYIGIRLVE